MTIYYELNAYYCVLFSKMVRTMVRVRIRSSVWLVIGHEHVLATCIYATCRCHCTAPLLHPISPLTIASIAVSLLHTIDRRIQCNRYFRQYTGHQLDCSS